jgi:hypothetical protein
VKKFLLPILLTLAACVPAFGASITLSTGASCVFKGIAFDAAGSAAVQCVDVAVVVPVPPVVTPPVVVAPPVVTTPPTTCTTSSGGGAFGFGASITTGPCVAGGMWIPGKRLSTGDMRPGDSVESTFTIPAGWSGVVEVGISGQNLNVYIDGRLYGDPRYDMKPGVHTLKVIAAATASGSIDLYHYP